MKRRTVHLAFGIVALSLAGTAAVLALRLQAAERSNAAMAAAAEEVGIEGDSPEAALARAIRLAEGEDYDRALRALEPLAQSPRADIREIARYDLGNLHMRQSARIVDFEVAKARTLVELAKQAYRRVLDENPMHWPARYNLERALWLEPEADDIAIESTPPPAIDRPNGDKPELP